MPGSVGQFEQIILTSILSLREEAYGVSIHEKAARLVAPKNVSLGAVYVTLDRLEDKGLIKSWLSDPTPERGGRSKRFYRLEALGERALQESTATSFLTSDPSGITPLYRRPVVRANTGSGLHLDPSESVVAPAETPSRRVSP